MEILYQHELVNVDGLQIKVTLFKRDARSPKETQNNAEIRYEHVYCVEVYDLGVDDWVIASEQILEYLQFDRQE